MVPHRSAVQPETAESSSARPSDTRRASLQRALAGVLGAALLAACESTSDASPADASTSSADVVEDHEAEIEADLCEHAAEGPFQTLEAGADQATAPEAYVSHTLLSVVASDAAVRRYLKLSVAEAGEHVIGTVGASNVVVSDSAGTAIPFEEEEAVTACTGIEKAHHLELGIGTHYLAFDVVGEKAGFVILTGEHGEDHHEDDETK
jgi:hypothetical protein